jgi:hypothetical protein
VEDGSQLRFSFFDFNLSAYEAATAEVSVDNGATWSVVWQDSGTATMPVRLGGFVFTPVQVPLKAFAGRIIRVRFRLLRVLRNGTSLYFPGDFFGNGFYFDDVFITGARRLTSVKNGDSPSATFSFTPPEAGSFLIVARPTYFGDYPGEFARPAVVVAIETPVAFTSWTRSGAGTIGLEFTAPAGAANGLVLERASTPSGPWAAVENAGPAIPTGLGAYRFTGIPAEASSAFFRVRTP